MTIPYVNIHTHIEPTSPNEIGIFNCDYNGSLQHNCSIGIHPYNSINIYHDFNFIKNSMAIIRAKAKLPEVIAIGETGLDALRGAEINVQKELFCQHIKISEITAKPLIIHCIKYIDEIIKIKKEMCPKQRWILHAYRKNIEQARQLIQQGIELSFGHYYNNEAIKYAFDANSLWIETDNDKTSIMERYKEVSEVLGISEDELKLNIYNRAIQLSSVFLRV